MPPTPESFTAARLYNLQHYSSPLTPLVYLHRLLTPLSNSIPYPCPPHLAFRCLPISLALLPPLLRPALLPPRRAAHLRQQSFLHQVGQSVCLYVSIFLDNLSCWSCLYFLGLNVFFFFFLALYLLALTLNILTLMAWRTFQLCNCVGEG